MTLAWRMGKGQRRAQQVARQNKLARKLLRKIERGAIAMSVSDHELDEPMEPETCTDHGEPRPCQWCRADDDIARADAREDR